MVTLEVKLSSDRNQIQLGHAKHWTELNQRPGRSCAAFYGTFYEAFFGHRFPAYPKPGPFFPSESSTIMIFPAWEYPLLFP